MIKAKQKGVALIVVLLLLVVITTISATMSERLFVHFQRASNQLNYQKAYWYGISLESLAQVGIEQTLADTDTVNLSQPWAAGEQVLPFDDGLARASLRDMQSCFNINVLSSPGISFGDDGERPFLVSMFQFLLEELEVDGYQAETIADSTWEFLNRDTEVSSFTGVGENHYSGLSPQYLPPNGLLSDVNELRAVYQISPRLMRQLEPLVCALPTGNWQLNVNTLTEVQAPLLVALFYPYFSEGDAVGLINGRPYDGWDSVSDFILEPEVLKVGEEVTNNVQTYLSVTSHYFELDARIKVSDFSIRLRSLFYSIDINSVIVARRRFGGVSGRVLSDSTQ